MCVPYDLIGLPLAANKGGPGCVVHVSRPVAGKTLNSAPVSMKKCRPDIFSVRKSRPVLGPAAVATIGDWPVLFPTKHKVGCTCGQPLQNYDDSNTNHQLQGQDVFFPSFEPAGC